MLDPTVEPIVPPEVEERIARSPDVPRGPGPGFLFAGLLPGLLVVGPLLGAALSAVRLFGTRLARRAVPIRGRRLRAQAVREARRMLEDLERAAVEQALAQHHGNRTHAAKTLGISVRTLQRKLKAWGMPVLSSIHATKPTSAKFLYTEQPSSPVANPTFSGHAL